MTRRLAPLLACLLLAAFAAACGGDDETETAATATPAPAPFNAKAVSKDLGAKPVVPATGGDPPTELQKTDIVKGKGRRAQAGETLDVDYVGISWSTGAQFDASWDRGQPISFPLGAGQVIPGWDQGVAGMRVGGRRVLVIPPDLGYGAQGAPPDIAPNETLVFVVDLKRIR
jgi:peptidylprolyl isomerase